MKKILLVEDDQGIVGPLSLYLKESGFGVVVAGDGEEAMQIFKQENNTLSLVVLDLNLPKKDGFAVCEEIRKLSNIPIIVLSARSGEDDKVRALGLGADDYVGKPFSPRELMARIGTIIKRMERGEHKKDAPGILVFGSLKLDIGGYLLTIGAQEIKVTKTEFLILASLIQHKDSVVEREKLMKEIIGYEHYLYDRTIDTHMKNLRRKIGTAANIETIRGIGYRIHL
ncbi:MAG: response regulator transcription factor [Candidatus Gracilibacteria bacterium]|nr:response regulator transcription factor [Candidatus Gracilibacteria bacterium]